jgi:coenzyme F420-dependent glucose-6-phosphate dehydrogenase
MAKIGFHASHEQFSPKELLDLVQRAEQAGFEAAMCSDHFYPWSERQGQSGFAWSWLGAALQATSLSFGVVNAPGQRYHPFLIAQAAATLAEMFPKRFWIAVGSGQALNEHITGERWPLKDERNTRLEEAVTVIKKLWQGKTANHEGTFRLLNAKLYTRPETPPLVVGAAITPETATWLGGWADALITISQPAEQLRKVVEAFRQGGGEGKPLFLQAKHAYDETDEAAQSSAYEQWRTNIFGSAMMATLRTPQEFDQAAAFVRPEDMAGPVRISSDLTKHLEWLQADIELGFDHIYVHNVGRNQRAFVKAFGDKVLPSLKDQS